MRGGRHGPRVRLGLGPLRLRPLAAEGEVDQEEDIG